MAALLRHGARRIGGSVLQRTKAAVTSPAVAEKGRRLVPRRMFITEEEIKRDIERKLDEELRDRARRLKPHQRCWELVKMFPGRKIVNVVVGTTVLVTLATAARDVK